MKKFWTFYKVLAVAIIAAPFFTACAVAPDHEFVVDYQVIGDRSVKYIYVPGEDSQAGGMFLDQAVAMEVCTIEAQVDPETSQRRVVETDCKQTRILRTQEYR